MLFRNSLFICFLLSVDLFASTMLTTGLSKIHALGSTAKIEIEQYYRVTPQYQYKGEVKGAWGSSQMDAKSVAKTDIDTAIYILSPEYGQWRFGFSYSPDYVYGGSTQWDDTIAKRYSKFYQVKYDVLSPQISYSITKDLFISLGAKVVLGKGEFTTQYSPFYDMSMSGSGVGTSLIGAISYRAANFLLLNASVGTITTVNLKGTMTTTSASPVPYSTTNNGDIDMIMPPWYLLNMTLFTDPTFALWLSYKKVLKTDPGNINLPLSQESIDSTLGSLTNPLGDIDVYYLGFWKKVDKHSLATTVGLSEPKINQKSITLSSQPLRTQFANVTYEYALSDKWSGGLKYTHIRFLEQKVENSKLVGKFAEAHSIVSSIFLKRSF